MTTQGGGRDLYAYAIGDLDSGPFWDHVRDMQFVQDRPGFLRIRLVADPDVDKDHIQRTFEQRLPMAKLEFEYVSHIDRSASGKRKYFINAL